MKFMIALAVVLTVASTMVGCKTEDNLDTQAPPIANPQKEIPPPGFKKKFADPPTMGAPPSAEQGK